MIGSANRQVRTRRADGPGDGAARHGWVGGAAEGPAHALADGSRAIRLLPVELGPG